MEENNVENKSNLAIRVQNVKKDFTVGTSVIPILFGISLDVQKGEYVMLVGPSGCGKSTLLHIIYGLEHPTDGSVFIDDLDIWSYTKDWRADFRNRRIGFIPQQAFWIKSLTVIENIAIPAIISGESFRSAIPRAAKLIELVGMGKWADYRPYDLSGGQQQRIALARSLLLDPSFLIADEPTGNLDQRAGEELLLLLKEINKKLNITILMVTHNTSQYKFGSRIVNMLDGKIVSDVYNKHSYDILEQEIREGSVKETGTKIV